MSSPATTPLKQGEYSPTQPSDLRSPCPALNALANHGYLPRTGRAIPASAFISSLDHLGVSRTLAALLTNPVFIEHSPPNKDADATAKPAPWWTAIIHPFNYVFGRLALRPPGQVDSNGLPFLNLDQLRLHNVIEHDVSLTRLDLAQGDNHSPNPQLVAELLAASSNGGISITVDDFVQLRKRRYAKQKEDHPTLEFGDNQNKLACGEVAFLLKVFGDGKEVPVGYMKAFFQDERLPWDEGWRKRGWWTLGLLELNALASKISGILGPPVKSDGTVADGVH